VDKSELLIKKMTLRQIRIVFCLLLLTSCSDDKIIYIQLSPEKLILENKEIDKADFEKELKVIVDKRANNGVDKKELTIDLKTDKRTKRGDLANIEVSLRRLNVKRVTYSTY
jgi:biopolymer transport protein ExbD